MRAHLSDVLKLELNARLYVRRDASPLTDRMVGPSPAGLWYLHYWLMCDSINASAGHIKSISATCACLLILPPLTGLSMCVCVQTVSLPLLSLPDFAASARPLTELIFPSTLCEGHLQRKRRERTEGGNQRVGRDSGQWEIRKWNKDWNR